MSLTTYQKKRDFSKTNEPSSGHKKTGKKLRFVVQRHHASHLHYDFRLEMEGVLKSWAVPKGPSLNPDDKRLAMMVEDHPYDYKDFEGEIPKGNYGAGNVMIYDEGFYEPVEETKTPEKELLKELHKGSLKFELKGKKLKGEWTLVKMHGKEENSWLLIKHKDKFSTDKKFDIENDIPTEEKAKGNKVGKEKEKKRKKEKKENPQTSNQKPQAFYTPMLTKLADEAFDNADWLFEYKFDGYRAIASVYDEKVSLYSRNHNSFNKKYPSIVNELKKLKINIVLDGEIVALDKNGKQKFQLLQNHQQKKADKLVYFVFDILYLNGHETMELPLSDRKDLLDHVFKQIDSDFILKTETIIEHGKKFFHKIEKEKGEGIIAKKRDSMYQPGKRNSDWLKIKTEQRQEAIICGYTEPQGARSNFGSLVLGVYEGKNLVHIGNCGTGFKEADLKNLYQKMKVLVRKTKPFKEAPNLRNKVTWLSPKLICEVKFSEWTKENHMRHPVFMGLRTDKKPNQVKKEIEIDVEKVVEDENEKKTDNESKKKPSKRPTKQTLKLNGHEVELTNLNKIFWPEKKLTKGDLLDYYNTISETILPYLKDRPLSLKRTPNGIKDSGFFQKDIDVEKSPKWLLTEPVYSESNDKNIDYLVCNDKATLMYMVNLGCIEINPWMSRIQHLEKPDYLVIDLDPVDIDFEAVKETALAVKEVLDEHELSGYCKTSGSKGIHIFIPFEARNTYEKTRAWAKAIATETRKKLPNITSMERSPKNRKKKVYLDYLQNSAGQTIAAPYSARPKPGATVSAPLEWAELDKNLKLADFTIENMQERLKDKGDLWKNMLKGKQTFEL